MKNIWTRKSEDKPLLILAPMAGYTDSAFRMLCRKFGADIVMTELISADAIAYGKFKVTQHCHPRHDRGSKIVGSRLRGNDRIVVEGKNQSTAGLLTFSDNERPIVIQLFGKYPEKFAFAAKWVAENLKPDGIDINMGCPARKVVGSDHGAALLKNPKLAVEIVKAVRAQIDIPLSVKTRLGWENDDEILEFAPKLIDAGADSLIIHGRTYKDGFKNKARWDNIYKVKSQIANRKLQTAIIGNGDIQSYEDAIEKSESNGVKLDGVAIGRAAFGKPWIFDQNQKTQSASWRTNHKLKKVILGHAKLVYETKGDHGIIEFRKHLLAYLKGFPDAKKLRLAAVKIETLEDVENIIKLIV